MSKKRKCSCCKKETEEFFKDSETCCNCLAEGEGIEYIVPEITKLMKGFDPHQKQEMLRQIVVEHKIRNSYRQKLRQELKEDAAIHKMLTIAGGVCCCRGT